MKTKNKEVKQYSNIKIIKPHLMDYDIKYDCVKCDGYAMSCKDYKPIHWDAVSPCIKHSGLEAKIND